MQASISGCSSAAASTCRSRRLTPGTSTTSSPCARTTAPPCSARCRPTASPRASTIRYPCICSRPMPISAMARATSRSRSAPPIRCCRCRCIRSSRTRNSRSLPPPCGRRPTLSDASRVVPAIHGVKKAAEDPAFFEPLAAWLREQFSREGLIDIYGRYMHGDDAIAIAMRAAIWRAGALRAGRGLQVRSGVGFKHLETFEIGDGVFIGAQTYVQGRFDGTCVIGDHTWIGPQSYFDARNLVIGDYVGWGPGAKVLGSAHTALPIDVPIIQTDLDIRPVRIESWADVGTNAVILPGVTVGRGAIVGAGAVVTHDVPPFSVVAGVPARVIRWRAPVEAHPTTEEAGILKWTR